MVKSTKRQHLREKVRAEVNRAKQTTLENIIHHNKTTSATVALPFEKKIEITEIVAVTEMDELNLKVGFKLIPSRTVFSKVISELYFDKQKIDLLRLRILQGPLMTDELEFSSVLSMTGIEAGQHNIRVEMYELWSTEEKLTFTSKEVKIDYIPLKKEKQFVKIPIVKRSIGADLTIVTDSEKRIYNEIEEDAKRETISRRDYW